jgi:hypothetical protein
MANQLQQLNMQSTASNVSTYPLPLASINHRHNNNNSTKPHPNKATTNKIIFPVPCVKDNMAADAEVDTAEEEPYAEIKYDLPDDKTTIKDKECTSHQAITLDYKDKTWCRDRDMDKFKDKTYLIPTRSNTSRIGTIATPVAMMSKTGITVPPALTPSGTM